MFQKALQVQQWPSPISHNSNSNVLNSWWGRYAHPEVKTTHHQFQYVSAQCKLEQMKETHVFLHWWKTHSFCKPRDFSRSLSLWFLSDLQILNWFWEYDCEWQEYYLHFPCCCGRLCSLESLLLLMIVLPATTAYSPPPFVLLSSSSSRLSFNQFLRSLDEKERETVAAVCFGSGCTVVYRVITDPSKKIKWDFRMIAITQCSLLPKTNEHFFLSLKQSCTRSRGQTVMRAS